jgi:hypothetical protein
LKYPVPNPNDAQFVVSYAFARPAIDVRAKMRAKTYLAAFLRATRDHLRSHARARA